MIYLAGFVLVYWNLLIIWLIGGQGRLCVTLAILGMGVIAVLRGDVGTDTATYESIISNIRHTYPWYEYARYGIEPGFVALSGVLTKIAESDQLAVRLISLIIIGGLMLFVYKADRDELFFILAYILPAFFYQYSMNVLRIGIASIPLLFSMLFLRRNKYIKASLLSWLSMSFHYSAIIAIFLLEISRRRWLNIINIIYLCSALIFIYIFIFYLNIDYFITKYASYSDIPPPSAFSGLSQVFMLIIILAALNISMLPIKERVKLTTLGGIMMVAFWIISNYSYAGLRLLDILTFGFPLAILEIYGQKRLPLDTPLKVALLASGILSAAAFYRRIFMSAGEGLTPFLPYESFLGWF